MRKSVYKELDERSLLLKRVRDICIFL